jgi:hypothetical protein
VELEHFQEYLYKKVNSGTPRPGDSPEFMALIQHKLYICITAKSAHLKLAIVG